MEENKRWRAHYKEYYFFINSMGEIESSKECDDEIDDKRFENRNYYQTQEEAEKALPFVLAGYKHE